MLGSGDANSPGTEVGVSTGGLLTLLSAGCMYLLIYFLTGFGEVQQDEATGCQARKLGQKEAGLAGGRKREKHLTSKSCTAAPAGKADMQQPDKGDGNYYHCSPTPRMPALRAGPGLSDTGAGHSKPGVLGERGWHNSTDTAESSSMAGGEGCLAAGNQHPSRQAIPGLVRWNILDPLSVLRPRLGLIWGLF